MLTGVSTEVVDAILAWWADQSITTEQILDGWNLEGVHGGTLWKLRGDCGSSAFTSVGDLIITDTVLIVSTAGTNLSVDIWNGKVTIFNPQMFSGLKVNYATY